MFAITASFSFEAFLYILLLLGPGKSLVIPRTLTKHEVKMAGYWPNPVCRHNIGQPWPNNLDPSRIYCREKECHFYGTQQVIPSGAKWHCLGCMGSQSKWSCLLHFIRSFIFSLYTDSKSTLTNPTKWALHLDYNDRLMISWSLLKYRW